MEEIRGSNDGQNVSVAEIAFQSSKTEKTQLQQQQQSGGLERVVQHKVTPSETAETSEAVEADRGAAVKKTHESTRYGLGNHSGATGSLNDPFHAPGHQLRRSRRHAAVQTRTGARAHLSRPSGATTGELQGASVIRIRFLRQSSSGSCS